MVWRWREGGRGRGKETERKVHQRPFLENKEQEGTRNEGKEEEVELY
jgi:hypothetical protein